MTKKEPTSGKKDSEFQDATDPTERDQDVNETSEEDKNVQEQDGTHDTAEEGDVSESADEAPQDAVERAGETANHDKVEDAPDAPDDSVPEEPAQVTTSQEDSANTGRSVVLAMILGGVVAAAAGFGAGRYLIPDPRLDDIRSTLIEQQKTISNLQDRVSAAQGSADQVAQAAAAAQENADRIDNISQTVSALETQSSETSTRLDELYARPAEGEGATQPDPALEQELSALREALAEQRAEIENLASTAQEQRAEAEMSAQEAMTRAALSRIGAALDSGAGFAAAVADLRDAGVEVPGDLKAVAADGVEPLASLQERFPELAREALAKARQASGEATGDVMGFLRAQLGLRSLEPREGSDPDAVLSRAEAALRDGRLTDTLAEVEQLPEEARAVLSGWIGDATTRRNATAAAEALAQTLNSN
ncbi:MAG: hypothetical protein RI566_04255 [Sediminimonas sp.]|uniref:COG4223 family protein n=1 Tax=Sediminimonas sp. TaxID=2823379 RepID=UPI002870652E|nr:mitofilin family membrane protein [Sediminimonas sp.]MDR9484363.1 hypothetical protein [Sediminimonas sp.]